jgi:hypothetical protein
MMAEAENAVHGSKNCIRLEVTQDEIMNLCFAAAAAGVTVLLILLSTVDPQAMSWTRLALIDQL